MRPTSVFLDPPQRYGYMVFDHDGAWLILFDGEDWVVQLLATF